MKGKLLYRKKEYLEKCKENGDCMPDIAKRFGLHYTTVQNWARKHNIVFEKRWPLLKKPRTLYTGLRFGKLIIGKFVRYRSHGNSRSAIYKIKCDCGNRGEMDSFLFITRKSHCGCVIDNKNKIIAGLNRRKNGDLMHRVYATYASGARMKDLEFFLSHDEFRLLTKGNCHYCNVEPSNKIQSNNREYIYNGIDRKNNDLGYTIDNCVPCCTQCNKAKRNLSYEDFIKWIKRLSEFSGLLIGKQR